MENEKSKKTRFYVTHPLLALPVLILLIVIIAMVFHRNPVAEDKKVKFTENEKMQTIISEKQIEFENMSAKVHLEKAKELGLMDSDAEKHLLAISSDTKEWADAQLMLKKINKIKHQNALEEEKAKRKQEITKRKDFAKLLEKTYLDNGSDVYVSTSGNNHTVLRIKWVLMSRPQVHDTVNRQEEMSMLKALGFKKIIFSDGFEEGWTYDL